MAKKDEYLTGYELGIKRSKTNEPAPPAKRPLSERVTDRLDSAFDTLANTPANIKNLRAKRQADDAYADTPMYQGEIKGRSDFDKALKSEWERSKTHPEVMPMTEEDAKVINSPEFKKADKRTTDMKKGGKVKAKKMSSGGKVGSASKRADGCCSKGKTKGRFV